MSNIFSEAQKERNNLKWIETYNLDKGMKIAFYEEKGGGYFAEYSSPAEGIDFYNSEAKDLNKAKKEIVNNIISSKNKEKEEKTNQIDEQTNKSIGELEKVLKDL